MSFSVFSDIFGIGRDGWKREILKISVDVVFIFFWLVICWAINGIFIFNFHINGVSKIFSHNGIIKLIKTHFFLLLYLISFFIFFYLGTFFANLFEKVLFKNMESSHIWKFNFKKSIIALTLGLFNILPLFILFSISLITDPQIDVLGILFGSYFIFFHVFLPIPVIYRVLKDIKFEVDIKKYIYFFLYMFLPLNIFILVFNYFLFEIFTFIGFLLRTTFPVGGNLDIVLISTGAIIFFFMFLIPNYLLWWVFLEIGKKVILLKKKK